MRADWISPFWQAALLPPRWNVAGFRLGPLTVWHSYALEQIGNAYLCGAPADRDAAASLLLFASLDYAAGRRLMLDAPFRQRQLLRMFRRLRRIPWPALDAACSEYVTTCMRAASRSRAGSALAPERVPAQWHLVRLLSGADPARLEAAWNTPYATGRALFDAWSEAEKGDDSLLPAISQELRDNWPADLAPAPASASESSSPPAPHLPETQ